MLRRVINLLTVSILMLTVLAVVLIGPRPFEGILPGSVVLALERVVGPEGLLRPNAVGADSVPEDFLRDSAEGRVATGPIAAAAGNQPVFIDQVLLGHTTDLEREIPAEITTIRPILGCLLTPPMAGTSVGHVTAGDSGMALPMVSYDDADLAEGVRQFVERYRISPSAEPLEVPGIAYQAFDVVVTDTSAPVYLVLGSGAGNRIWNLHLADGVRVERVILLGGNQAGVANLDPVVPVEVLLADGLRGCGIDPAYPFSPGQRAARSPGSDDGIARAEAFDTWFRDSFGVAASAVRIGFDRGEVAVIGPVPDVAGQRVVYRRIAGSRVRMTEDTYAEVRGQVADGRDFAARVLEITTGFARGDLGLLRQGGAF
jgi:hypothetical protein